MTLRHFLAASRISGGGLQNLDVERVKFGVEMSPATFNGANNTADADTRFRVEHLRFEIAGIGMVNAQRSYLKSKIETLKPERIHSDSDFPIQILDCVVRLTLRRNNGTGCCRYARPRRELFRFPAQLSSKPVSARMRRPAIADLSAPCG